MQKQEKTKKIFLTLPVLMLLVGSLLLVGNVLAQVNVGLEYGTATGLGTEDIRVTVANVIRVIIGLLGIIAVALVIYGGFIWMTAAGDAEKIAKAKEILTAAIIGLVIILAAFAITSFIISRLLGATGAAPGEITRPGEGPGGGGLPADAFIVKSVSPQGRVEIRDVIVEVAFSKKIDSANLADNLTIKKIEVNGDIGERVEGDLLVKDVTILGRIVSAAEFTPKTPCPGNQPGEDDKCFDKNTKHVIEAKGGIGGIKSVDAQNLICLTAPAVIGNGACQAYFETGEKIDRTPPTVEITSPSDKQAVSADDFIPIEAKVTDDAGIRRVEFYVDDALIGRDVPQGDTPKDYQAGADWDTTGLALKSQHTLKAIAYDIDDNEKTSDTVSVTILAAHCFNDGQAPDADETGVDCGGKDCRKCPGEGCASNSDCASGACVGGKCVSYPTIWGVIPANGAVGNYITIQGQYFDDYEADKSKVIFLGGAGDDDDKPASLPAGCGTAGQLWQRNQIVIEAPEGAKSGPLKVIAKNTFWDDTVNDRGWQGNFEINNVKRPSLCTVSPKEGEFKDTLIFQGKNFGSKAGAVKFGTISAGGTLVWQDNKIEGATVPNLEAGVAGVAVVADKESSNSLNFKVKLSGVAPRLSDVDPWRGPVGQYVTLFGSNFGSLAGGVTFINQTSQAETPADISFPSACKTDYWHDDHINIKVPGVDVGDYKIKVTKEGGQESNQADFKVIVGSPGPGICRFNPSSGPLGTEVEFNGENFGADANKVKFHDSQEDGAISFWDNNNVKVLVPPRAATGPVRVIDKDGNLSNKVNFRVGSCADKTVSCASGKECCGDGSCRKTGTCLEKPPLCTYAWRFTTGKGFLSNNKIDPGEQCDGSTLPTDLTCADLGCAGYGNMKCVNGQLVCTNAQGNVCPQTCNSDGTAGEGEQCDGDDVRGKSCTNWGFSAPPGLKCTECRFNTIDCRNAILPRVVRDSSCVDNTQSPSPQENSLENCVNTNITVKFNMNMDDATVPQNIELKKCNLGVPLKTEQCAGLENYHFDGFINQNTEQESLIIDPLQELAVDTWYQLTLKSGEAGIKNLAGWQLDGNNDGREGGDFVMHFKTRNTSDPCELDHIVVTPPAKTLVAKNETQNYRAVPFAKNCNALPGGGYGWTWASSVSSVASITRNDSDNNTKIDPAQTATALAEGQTVIKAETQGLNDTGNLTVDFEDVRVVAKWPSCDSACRNAQIGARFNLDMNQNSLLPAAVKLYSCGDSTCSKTALAPVPLSRVQYSQPDKEVYVIPAASLLGRNQRYRTVIKGGAGGVKSASDTLLVSLNYDDDGDGANDSYSWYFKTKDDATVCLVDHVGIMPARAALHLIGATQDYMANAYGSPDTCNQGGQRLNALSYDWTWASSKTYVAEVSQQITMYASPPLERGNPSQTATARGVEPGTRQGTTNIITSASDKNAGSELTVVCGRRRGDICQDSAGRGLLDTYGVGDDTCCHPRPLVTAKEPTDAPADTSDDICRNSIIKATFSQKMIPASLVGNIEVKVKDGAFATGQTKVENVGDGSVITFTPNDFFIGNKTYQVKIKGDANLVDTQVTGVRSEAGVEMKGDYTWEFRVKDEICVINSVEVRITPNITLSPPSGSIIGTKDFFSCAGRDDCLDDADGATPDSQHRYLAQAKDKSGQSLAAAYQWTKGFDIIKIVPWSDNTATADQPGIAVTPKGNNGQTNVTVKASDPRVSATNIKFKTVDILIYICENPWPSVRTFPYQDIVSEPKTNYSIFYCRDDGRGRICRGGNDGQVCAKSGDCNGGACVNDRSDDLPPIGKQGAGNVWEPVIVTPPAASEMLKEFLMPVR